MGAGGGHSHEHEHSHAHGVSADAQGRWLAIALAVIVGFMVVEVVAGVIANSVALISDAAHMLTDAAAIALALGAVRLAARPPSGRFTFGFKRAEILSAQINGASLLVFAALIGYEAVGRLADPPDVDGGFVIVVGVLGALVNVVAAWALSRASRRSLNVEGAYLHALADLLSSLFAAVAGVVIVLTGFDQADAIAALAVCAIMLRGGWRLLRDSGRILLEGAPKGMDADEIAAAIAGHPGVVEVHDLHVWEVTSGFPALSAHVLVPAGEDCHALRRELDRMVAERFEIDHATLQVEHAPAERLLQIEPGGDDRG
ncbi:MAG: cation transporter [Solirubrobacterales bacterium]|nr:cation transporter [Solirubrobacterales bacterium]